MRFGVRHTLRALVHAELRPKRIASRDLPTESGTGARGRWSQSPDGGLIADYLGPIGYPRELSAHLSGVPGLIAHGLFPPEMVSLILIAGEHGVERRPGKKLSS
jgi:ribose 5-phosphate isomerase